MTSRILVVDDDKSAVSTLVRALSTELRNTSFHVASGVEEALVLARNERPEVAVLDLSLNPEEGVESGFSLLKQGKVGGADYVILSKKQRMDFVIHKPFSELRDLGMLQAI